MIHISPSTLTGCLTILILLALTQPSLAGEKGVVSLENGLLSLDARNETAENIFKDMGDTCGIKIVVNQDSFPDDLVSIKFSRLPLNEGVKKVLKATRVSNYILLFHEDGDQKQLSGIEFLGNRAESKILSPGMKGPSNHFHDGWHGR